MLHMGTICSLTKKTPFLYRYLLQIVPPYSILSIFNKFFIVYFGVIALKVSGIGNTNVIAFIHYIYNCEPCH